MSQLQGYNGRGLQVPYLHHSFSHVHAFAHYPPMELPFLSCFLLQIPRPKAIHLVASEVVGGWGWGWGIGSKEAQRIFYNGKQEEDSQLEASFPVRSSFQAPLLTQTVREPSSVPHSTLQILLPRDLTYPTVHTQLPNLFVHLTRQQASESKDRVLQLSFPSTYHTFMVFQHLRKHLINTCLLNGLK